LLEQFRGSCKLARGEREKALMSQVSERPESGCRRALRHLPHFGQGSHSEHQGPTLLPVLRSGIELSLVVEHLDQSDDALMADSVKYQPVRTSNRRGRGCVSPKRTTLRRSGRSNTQFSGTTKSVAPMSFSQPRTWSDHIPRSWGGRPEVRASWKRSPVIGRSVRGHMR
jgi:hypothetical protein